MAHAGEKPTLGLIGTRGVLLCLQECRGALCHLDFKLVRRQLLVLHELRDGDRTRGAGREAFQMLDVLRAEW